MDMFERIKEQEEQLQFVKFDNTIALEIGYGMMKKAMECNLPIAIDIMRLRQQIFHAALAGTTADNDYWLKRKINTVYHFSESSLMIQMKLERNYDTLEEAWGLSGEEYAAAGGAFPVKVRGVGMIGTIAVSGLTSEEDHQFIVDFLREYLWSEKEKRND
ncbi:MAG: heme-degrading domain-containing protein [Suipraeoptans sp.]